VVVPVVLIAQVPIQLYKCNCTKCRRVGSKEPKLYEHVLLFCSWLTCRNVPSNTHNFFLVFSPRPPASSLDQDRVEALLQRPVLGVYCDDASLAIKITCDRGINAGSQGDRDVYGAQQHRILVDLPM
jgi:hypothetical protein